jgi:acyl carrier protein
MRPDVEGAQPTHGMGAARGDAPAGVPGPGAGIGQNGGDAEGDEVTAGVGEILARTRGLPRAPLLTDELATDLGCTSFDMMVVSVEVEQAFGVVFDFSLMAGARTVGDLCAAVRVMLAAPRGGAASAGQPVPKAGVGTSSPAGRAGAAGGAHPLDVGPPTASGAAPPGVS